MKKTLLPATAFALVLALPAAALDLYVSTTGSDSADGLSPATPLKTLLAAYDKAGDGDTIHLLAGDYTELTTTANSADSSADYLAVVTKGVTIVGDGPETTILHAVNTTSASTRRGGIWINNAGALLAGVTVCDSNKNSADAHKLIGAAVHVQAGTVSNCVFRHNGTDPAIAGRQGPVALNGANALMTHCIVRDNIQFTSGKGAGGIYVANGAVVRHCQVLRNFIGDIASAGGIHIANGTVTDTLVAGNSGFFTFVSGTTCAGGVLLERGTLERCVIVANTNAAPNTGTGRLYAGGLVVSPGSYSATVRNCLVAQNICAAMQGSAAGGVVVSGNLSAVSHLTVADNVTGTGPSGLLLLSGTVANSVVDGEGWGVARTGGTISNSCFPEAAGVAGTANIASAPLLLNRLAPNSTNGIESAYALSSASPCRDAAAVGHATDDLTGAARPVGAAPDIGCRELPAAASGALVASFGVSATMVPAGGDVTLTAHLEGPDSTIGTLVWSVECDGSSTSYTTSTAALTLSGLAAGDYDVTLVATAGGGDEAAPFLLEKAFSVRPVTTYVATDGSDTWPYDTPSKAARNLRDAVRAVCAANDFTGTVVVAAGTYDAMALDSSAIYSRLAIVNRPIAVRGPDDPADCTLRYDIPGKTDFGGGLLVNHPDASVSGLTVSGKAPAIDVRWHIGNACHLAAGTVSNCVFTGCGFSDTRNSTHTRPPVAISGGLMTDCEISDNRTTGYWGRGANGVYITGGELRRCRVERNGISVVNSDRCCANGIYMTGGTVRDCIVADNFGGHANSDNGAGGIRADAGLIERCVIQCNTNATATKAKLAGGVLLYGGATLRNCLVIGNSAATSAGNAAGGVFVNNASAVIEHCTVAANVAPSSTGGLAAPSGGKIRGTIVHGNTGPSVNLTHTGANISFCCYSEAPSGGDSIADDPLFAEPDASVRADLNAPCGFALSRVSRCRDAITSGSNWVADDLVGTARPTDGATTGDWPDIGCYELAAADGLVASFAPSRRTAWPGCELTFTASLEGADTTLASGAWEITNRTTGAFSRLPVTGATLVLSELSLGNYDVTLFATNSSGIGAEPYSFASAVTILPVDTYVAPHGAHVWPFDSPARAASNVFEAVGAVYGEVDRTGTVHIAAGDYTELQRVITVNTFTYIAVLDKPVRVTADDGPDLTILHTAASDPGGGFIISHPGVSLAGVTVTGYSLNTVVANWILGGLVHMTAGVVSNCVMTGYYNSAEQMQVPVSVNGGLLVDCTIRGNHFKPPTNMYNWGRGALGVYITAGEMRGCLIAENSIPYNRGDYMYAGGVYQTGGVVRDCTIARNYAVRNINPYPIAGGARVDGGLFERCAIIGNTNATETAPVLSDTAGGLIVNGAATVRNVLVADNVLLANNNASAAGLALTANAGSASVANATVADNAPTGASVGAAYIAAGTIVNAILWSGATEGVVVSQAGGTLSHSCYPGAAKANGNIAADPRFRRAGDYRLRSDSPCRNAGTMADWTADDIDLAGRPRIIGRAVDMGCYELDRSVGLRIELQ